MQNTTIDLPAKVGCPSFRIQFREVFPDQVDALGADCLHCQGEKAQVTVNLYLTYADERALLNCCVPCVAVIVMDQCTLLDNDHEVIAEFALVD
jgi:hypothetical protein